MSEKSASFKKGKGNVEHNNREEKIERDNIDNERTKNNIQIGKKIDLREFYEQTFGQAVKDYNEKQTREDRKIGSYYDKISADSKKNLFYEIVVQIGDMHDTNCKDNPEKEIALLEEYAKEFEIRNPTLKVFNAIIHMDEETPHLHLDYVPVAKNLTRGMSVQNSQTKALEQNINIVAAKKNFINEEKLKGKKSNPLIDKFFLEQERTHISKLMEQHLIKQKDKEEFKRGDLTVAQYKVAAKIGTSLSQKFIDNINKKNLEMDFKKVLGKKIITDDQIEEINNKLSLKEFEIDKLKLKVSELISGIEKANTDKEKFMRNNLSKKYVSQEILITELSKELDKVNEELNILKSTPNAALEIANKKIQELELASKNKKEQEDKKVSALKVQQEIDRAAKKRLEDKISILDKDNLKLQGDILKERTDRVNTWDYLWNVISEIAVKLFSEDFSFQEVVDRIKEDFFDKKGVISYQDHNNQKKDLIVEIVSDVADKIELDKKTVKSKENGRQ